MIAQIDAARRRHNDAISAAMAALNELAALTVFPDASDFESHYLNAIDGANIAADAEINRYAHGDDPGARAEAQTVINVGGDYIDVDISDSENVAVGKNIGQTIEEIGK